MLAGLRPLSRARALCSAAGSYDAVVIGAGIIGSSIAVELSRRGHRTLNLERLGAAGAGSTSYSSGICRMMYSVPDSAKFAWEGYTYYDRWAEHIGVDDPAGLASMRRCGALVIRTPGSETYLRRVMAAYDEVGLEYVEWGNAELEARGMDVRSFGPPRRVDDERFGEPAGTVEGGVHFPLCGYVSSPDLAARNLQTAAEATGRASFLFGATVCEIRRDASGGAVRGVRLADGREIHSPVVINAAGPGSSAVTDLAFPVPSENDMRLSTRAMRQEVAYAPGPDVSWCTGGPSDLLVTDMDAGVYYRPENGGV